MTKHTVTHKNTTDSHEQREEQEEEGNTLESNVRKVRKPTEETPDAQGVRDVTEAVMEERRVEKRPLNTRDQTPRCLSMERHELTGTSGKSTKKVWQQEAANEPPDHKRDL